MATLEINGRDVDVDDAFLSLSPEQQERTVREIAATLGQQEPPRSDAYSQGLGELSAITQSFDGNPVTPPQMSAAPQAGQGGQTFGGAAQTWAEHFIGDLPVVGPYLQRGSDFVGTEILGRLSGEDPAQMREGIRERREGRSAAYPASSASGGIGGNLAVFGAAGATKQGAQMLGMEGGGLLSRMLTSGRTSGAIGTSDSIARGDSPADIINRGVIDTAIGAAIPGLGSAVRMGAGYVGEKLAPFIGAIRNPMAEAERQVGVAARRDLAADPAGVMNAADEAAALRSGVPMLNADRGGETVRGLARSVANQSPEARGIITRTANDRFAGQSNRAADTIRRIAGGNIDDLALQDGIRDAARMANAPAYKLANSQPAAQAMWNRELAQLMQAPAIQQAARAATTRGANRAALQGVTPIRNPFRWGEDGRIRMAADAQGNRILPNLQFWDQTKRNLDSMIGRAKRAGDDTLVGDLTALKSELVRKLDAMVPEYQSARQGAAGFFGAEDSIEAGRKFANAPRAIPEAKRAFMKMTAPERKGFAIGYASELVDRIKASGDSQNVIRQVFGSQASRESVELVFGKARARELEAYVRVESLVDRLRGSMGGTTTARQLVELGLGATAGGFYSGDIQGAITGAALVRAPRQAAMMANNRILQNVAKVLTSNDPAAFKKLVANAALEPRYMQTLDALGRALGGPVRGLALESSQ